MNYKIALSTDSGIKRAENQDSSCIKIAATDKGSVAFALMCDGMGGLSKGELASGELVRCFSRWFETEMPHILAQPEPVEEIRYQWSRLIKKKNQDIGAYGRSRQMQLGSTLTALLILEDGSYIIGHVGDSRAYKITDSSITILTEDQTVAAREAGRGAITPEEAENDPRRNVLLQCVGASRTVEPAFYFGKIFSRECLMLCSDGFRHNITPDEILNAFCPKNNPDEYAMKSHIEELIGLNKSRLETDNITAMLIKAESEG